MVAAAPLRRGRLAKVLVPRRRPGRGGKAKARGGIPERSEESETAARGGGQRKASRQTRRKREWVDKGARLSGRPHPSRIGSLEEEAWTGWAVTAGGVPPACSMDSTKGWSSRVRHGTALLCCAPPRPEAIQKRIIDHRTRTYHRSIPHYVIRNLRHQDITKSRKEAKRERRNRVLLCLLAPCRVSPTERRRKKCQDRQGASWPMILTQLVWRVVAVDKDAGGRAQSVSPRRSPQPSIHPNSEGAACVAPDLLRLSVPEESIPPRDSERLSGKAKAPRLSRSTLLPNASSKIHPKEKAPSKRWDTDVGTARSFFRTQISPAQPVHCGDRCADAEACEE